LTLLTQNAPENLRLNLFVEPIHGGEPTLHQALPAKTIARMTNLHRNAFLLEGAAMPPQRHGSLKS
jgi:hypothetical protein